MTIVAIKSKYADILAPLGDVQQVVDEAVHREGILSGAQVSVSESNSRSARLWERSPFQQQGSQTLVWSCLLVLLSGVLCLIGCNSGSNPGSLPAVSDPAGVRSLFARALWRCSACTARRFLQEDIDRLQSLLRPEAVSGQRLQTSKRTPAGSWT